MYIGFHSFFMAYILSISNIILTNNPSLKLLSVFALYTLPIVLTIDNHNHYNMVHNINKDFKTKHNDDIEILLNINNNMKLNFDNKYKKCINYFSLNNLNNLDLYKYRLSTLLNDFNFYHNEIDNCNDEDVNDNFFNNNTNDLNDDEKNLLKYLSYYDTTLFDDNYFNFNSDESKIKFYNDAISAINGEKDFIEINDDDEIDITIINNENENNNIVNEVSEISENSEISEVSEVSDSENSNSGSENVLNENLNTIFDKNMEYQINIFHFMTTLRELAHHVSMMININNKTHDNIILFNQVENINKHDKLIVKYLQLNIKDLHDDLI